jgi:hypothetical protein
MRSVYCLLTQGGLEHGQPQTDAEKGRNGNVHFSEHRPLLTDGNRKLILSSTSKALALHIQLPKKSKRLLTEFSFYLRTIQQMYKERHVVN